jgi:D-alanyl-D-alanine carboxypeptidase/D-alanyl-D-alanine-endopeptidase (penicillin-binding protein 4)
VWLLTFGLWASVTQAWTSPANQLRDFLQQDRFAQATWGVHVESLDAGKVVFSTNGHRLLQPASSAKLLVAALALDQFGMEHQFVTTLHTDGTVDSSGLLNGRLLVRGSGDFSWSDEFGAGRPERVLAQIARIVTRAGIQKVRAGIAGDTRLFRGPVWGAGWAWDDLQFGYGGELSALMIRDGRLELRLSPGGRVGSPCAWRTLPPVSGLDVLSLAVTVSGSEPARILTDRPPGSGHLVVTGQLPLGGEEWRETLSVPDPPRAFLMELQQRLVAAGVEVGGKVEVLDITCAPQELPDYGRLAEVGRIVSPPLKEMVKVMLARSQNQYAQILLLQVGAVREGHRAAEERSKKPAWTADYGMDVLREFLNRAGVRSQEIRLDEASGLARSDRLSPAALVQLLRFMERHPEQEMFRASLPSLTLKSRVGNVKLLAKSGTMSDIYALAGYAEIASGERRAFSVMLNGFVPRARGEGRQAVEDCVRLAVSLGIAEFSRD